jgi:hypothetical protein
LYKNFDEKKNELNIIKEKEIEEFINKYSTPKLMTLNKKAVNFIFEKKIPGIILYANEKSKRWAHYKNLMLNNYNIYIYFFFFILYLKTL